MLSIFVLILLEMMKLSVWWPGNRRVFPKRFSNPLRSNNSSPVWPPESVRDQRERLAEKKIMEVNIPAAIPFPSVLQSTVVTDPFTKPDIENDPAYIFNVGVYEGLLAATSSTNAVKVYDLNTHALVSQCVGHTGTITDAYFASNGAYFTSSMDGTARMWDIKSGKCEQVFHGSF